MPLLSTGCYPFVGPRNAGVGVTMLADDREVIAYMTLEDLRTLAPRSQDSPVAIFRLHLAEIEGAACRKFEAQGVSDDGLLLVEPKDIDDRDGVDALTARLKQTKDLPSVAASTPGLRFGRARSSAYLERNSKSVGRSALPANSYA